MEIEAMPPARLEPARAERDRPDPEDLRQAGPELRRHHGPLRAALLRGYARVGLLTGRGDVLEIAAGTARNLEHYPATVSAHRGGAQPGDGRAGRKHAEEIGREIDMRVGDAECLDFPDESFDTVVCTYGLCTIPDDRAAVREAKRVLRPGGRILLAEHVRSPNPVVRTIQRLIDPLAHRFGGDHLLREPLEPLTEEGFEIEEVQRRRRASSSWSGARQEAGMRPRHFTPLLGIVLPSLLIGFAVVIPGSCIAGFNQLSVGFATTLLGACGSYWLGIRAVLADAHRSEVQHG